MTGDDHANVYESDWLLRIEVWSRSIIAPWEVRQFTQDFDDLDRRKNGRAKLPRRLEEPIAPFTFEIPDPDDSEWDERCYNCEGFFKADELSDEGCCKECLAKENE